MRVLFHTQHAEDLKGGVDMGDHAVVDELWRLLRPFIKEHPMKKDTVQEDDIEMLISGAVAFHVEDELLSMVRANPNGVFWDFGMVIPEGVPPGQEDILDDEE